MGLGERRNIGSSFEVLEVRGLGNSVFLITISHATSVTVGDMCSKDVEREKN